MAPSENLDCLSDCYFSIDTCWVYEFPEWVLCLKVLGHISLMQRHMIAYHCVSNFVRWTHV